MSSTPTEEAVTSPEDARVVSILVENHRAFLDFLQRRVGDRATAEDILQTAFARGLAAHGELREQERAVAWF